MILTITPNPCVDKTVFIDELKIGAFIRARRCTCIPGGKGTNVSRAVKQLGRPTKALVVVGGHPGAHVVDMIRNQDGVECIPAWVADRTRTITTVLEEPVHRQTAFFEPGPRVTEREAAAILEVFRGAIHDARVATFNGTVPDPGLAGLYREMIAFANACGVMTILDAHGPELALGIESAPYMVKPNLSELEELDGRSLASHDLRRQAMDHLHARGVRLVVLSLGEEGALVSQDGECLRVRPPRIREVNPVGSGDALVAGFAIGLLEEMSLDGMAKLGCAAGAANAMSWDIGHFTKAHVEELMDRVTVERGV